MEPDLIDTREELTELEYLRQFRWEADFGPADSDVKRLMD